MNTAVSKPSWQGICERMNTVPMFKPYLPIFTALGDTWPSIDKFNEVANHFSPDLALKFIPQPPSSRRKRAETSSLRGYIQQIVEDRVVPMRPLSVHDLFNYLTFVLFPKSKQALMKIHQDENQRIIPQFQDSLPRNGGRGRTRMQDLATLFDEGGSISLDPSSQDVIVFGHGILEQFILQPRRVRAFCWTSSLNPTLDIAMIDNELAMELADMSVLTNSCRFSGQWIPESISGLSEC